MALNVDGKIVSRQELDNSTSFEPFVLTTPHLD
jgi:hypothetical protein